MSHSAPKGLLRNREEGARGSLACHPVKLQLRQGSRAAWRRAVKGTLVPAPGPKRRKVRDAPARLGCRWGQTLLCIPSSSQQQCPPSPPRHAWVWLTVARDQMLPRPSLPASAAQTARASGPFLAAHCSILLSTMAPAPLGPQLPRIARVQT